MGSGSQKSLGANALSLLDRFRSILGPLPQERYLLLSKCLEVKSAHDEMLKWGSQLAGGLPPHIRPGHRSKQPLEKPVLLAALRFLAEIDEDRAGGVEAFAGQGGDVHGGERGRFQPADAVFDHPDLDRGQRRDRGRVIEAEDDAHFTHESPGLADARDLEAVAAHRQPARHQDIKLATGLASLDEVLAGREAALRPGVGEGQKIGHVVPRVAVVSRRGSQLAESRLRVDTRLRRQVASTGGAGEGG